MLICDIEQARKSKSTLISKIGKFDGHAYQVQQ